MRHARVVTFVLAVAVPLTAAADKPPKSGKGKGHKHGNADAEVVVTFTSEQRQNARLYYEQTYGRGNCPPGLAKKNNGCLPPGQAKKRYVVGQPLPTGVEIRVLPPELEVRIGPPPNGYRYGIIDGDVVKLVVGTMLVVDAIQGMVN